MKFGSHTRGLWLRARYRQRHFEGEACLLVYDDESFGDLLVSGDIKAVFDRRASTADIFIAAPFLKNTQCREALRGGAAVRRAASYLADKSGNVHLIELHPGQDADSFVVKACPLTWDPVSEEARFGQLFELASELKEGWLFDLFDSNEGLVVAPAGVHFRKSSRKHTTTFLRAANALTSSAACGLLALFALAVLGRIRPKRIFVDTAPLLSLAFALMHVARAHTAWTDEIPARSFSSYGGMHKIGKLSASDIILVSATTSGSLAHGLIEQGARSESVVTLYYLAAAGQSVPKGVLCDLSAAPAKAFGYQPVINYAPNDCKLCKSSYLLAELEGDQFLLQQRQHRLLRVLKKTQSEDARTILTELYKSRALAVIFRAELAQAVPLLVDEDRLLSCKDVRADFIRLLRRYCPQPLALLVLVNLSEATLRPLLKDAGMEGVVASARIIDWSELPSIGKLERGTGVLVVFGFLSSHTDARSVNASLRPIVDEGNVAYLSVLTMASSPEQYHDLKIFLGFGERGPETFTFREARRLALPNVLGQRSAWDEELDLLDRLAASGGAPELEERRRKIADTSVANSGLFLAGRSGELQIQKDFVYLDTKGGASGISQADVFAVVANLLCVARAADRELGSRTPSGVEPLEFSQSVYGHVLLHPVTFLNYNDAVLKASVLRAARPSEMLYEVDESYSTQIAEIVLAELAGWPAGSGDALPEMLLSLATQRLRLRELDRLNIRAKAIAANLPPLVHALACAIPP